MLPRCSVVYSMCASRRKANKERIREREENLQRYQPEQNSFLSNNRSIFWKGDRRCHEKIEIRTGKQSSDPSSNSLQRTRKTKNLMNVAICPDASYSFLLFCSSLFLVFPPFVLDAFISLLLTSRQSDSANRLRFCQFFWQREIVRERREHVSERARIV